jgi:hypothetical protein
MTVLNRLLQTDKEREKRRKDARGQCSNDGYYARLTNKIRTWKNKVWGKRPIQANTKKGEEQGKRRTIE